MLTAFNGAETKDITLNLVDALGNSYTLNMPKCLITGGQTDVTGDADITIPVSFTAIAEPGSATPWALKITRLAD